jgi:tetratricopeptide (TPR) repeat protein
MRGSAEWARAETTWMLFDLGRWDELLEVAEVVARFDEREGGVQQGLIASSYAGHVHLRRGELARAARVCERYLDRARAALDPQVVGPTLSLQALVRAAEGSPGEALEAVHELIDATRDRADWHRGRFLPELVRLCTGLAAREAAEELAAPLRTQLGRTSHAIVAAHAELAEADGRYGEALALHDDAAARWGLFGRLDGRADSLLGAGRCLLALGRDDEARGRLADARAIYEGLGARPSIAEVDELLGDQPASARAAT